MRVRGVLFVLLSTFAFTTGPLVVAENQPAQAAANSLSCTDIYILGARGSGEDRSDEYGWCADVVGRTVASFKVQVQAFEPGMRFHDLALTLDQYPATGDMQSFIVAGVGLPGAYHDSVVQGKNAGRGAVDAVIGNAGACILFTGYSQGAQVAGDLLEEYAESHPDKVLGGMFYGDPYFNPLTAGASSGLYPIPFFPLWSGGLGQRDKYPDSLQGRQISMCHGFDVVCQGPNALNPIWQFHPHTTYTRKFESDPLYGTFDMTGEATLSARAIVSRMGFSRLPLSDYETPVDIVFAVDTTGSMGGAIEDAQQFVRGFPAALEPLLPDSRFGLVAYRDQGDDYVARIETQPTEDLAVFTAAVDGLAADGGGDIPEAVLAAVQTAMNLNLRPEARKFIILLGDAPGHDPDLVTGVTADEVVNEARLKFISISAVDYGGGTTTFEDLAVRTGGLVTDPYANLSSESLRRALMLNLNEGKPNVSLRSVKAANGGQNVLVEAVVNAVSQPDAQVTASTPTYVGVPTGLNASGSTDPLGYIAQYEWDFDNDEVFDLTTVEPTVVHTFNSVGSKTVTVRVTNDADQSSIASVEVNVEQPPVDYPDAPPEVPPAPTAVAGDAQIEVTIQPNATGPAVSYYTVSNGATGDFVAHVLTADDGTPVSMVRLNGATNGQPYTFRVSATNERGQSALGQASAEVTPSAPPSPPQPPRPPRPPSTPDVPPLEPGEAFAAERGAPVSVAVDPLDARVLRVSGTGFSVDLDSRTALGYPVVLDGRVMSLRLDGSLGFASPPGTWQGGSNLTLHLFSRGISPGQASVAAAAGVERLLGVATVDQDGSIRGAFKMPSDLQPGRVVVKAAGRMPSGEERIVALGVQAETAGTPSISITGFRGSGNDSARVFVSGVTTDLVSGEVTPWIKIKGQRKYSPGTNIRQVALDGTFTWNRKTGKKVYVYFRLGDVRSNMVRIRGR